MTTLWPHQQAAHDKIAPLGRLKQAVEDSGTTVKFHIPATGQTAVLGGKHDDDGIAGRIGQAVGE